MSFRWITLIGLIVATLPCFSRVYGQAASRGDSIVFSSPDGQAATNSTVPAAHAPELPNRPATQSAPGASLFSPQLHSPMLRSGPLPTPPARAQDATDPRRPLTAAQIMGVPSLEQIFGLPERPAPTAQQIQAASQRGYTNIIFSGDSTAVNSAAKPSFGDSDWAKIFSGNPATNASHMDNSQDFFAGVFNHAPGHGFFDGANPNNSAFGSPPATRDAQQPDANSFAGTANSGDRLSQNLLPGSINSGLNWRSPQAAAPFALPKSATLATLPQLPVVRTAPGQNYNAAPSTPPSWEPKAPPWASSQPVPGAMEQRKF